MKKINRKHLPTRPPLYPTLTTWLALSYWHAPEWVWGAVGFMFLIIWIFVIVEIAKQEEIDITNTLENEDKINKAKEKK